MECKEHGEVEKPKYLIRTREEGIAIAAQRDSGFAISPYPACPKCGEELTDDS